MSTSKCHVCGRGGYENSDLDSILGAFHLDAYYDDYPYEWWQSRATEGNSYEVPAIGYVKLVHRVVPSSDSVEKMLLVFEIEGTLYKKEGTTDSYSNRWDGVFKETREGTREVVYYE